jgi:hypothetical protein
MGKAVLNIPNPKPCIITGAGPVLLFKDIDCVGVYV